MPVDPAQFATTPEGIQAEKHADFDRRLRSLEGGNTGARSAYSEMPYFSTNIAGTFTPSYTAQTKLYVPDTPGTILEVFAETLMQASSGGDLYVQIGIQDATIMRTWTVFKWIFTLPTDAGMRWLFSAPGIGGSESHGSWIVFPREVLKSAGLALDQVLTCKLIFTLAGGPLGEWYQSRLWTRIR